MQKAHKVNLTFQLKRGTAARWLEVNPILADGEPGFELDTNQLKIGNGKDVWTNLPYVTDTTNTVTEEELANAIDIAKEEILNQSGLYELSYDKTANEIKLTNKNTGEVSKIPTLDFIKDGMIDKVELSTDKKFLNIIWNTDAGKQTTSIPMESFIDKYVGQNTDTINLVIDNNAVSAEVKAGALTNAHLATNANIEASKLSSEIRTKLEKAHTAVQPETLEAEAQKINNKMNELGDSINAIGNIDWNIVDESNPAAIKNKPFGMVEQIVDVVPEAEYNFTKPHEMTTDIVCFSAPSFNDLFYYDAWFNDIYLGMVKPGDRIEIPNGQFSFGPGAMAIAGGNYPEGNYKVHIRQKQEVAKKLDSQWLNTQSDIYAMGVSNDPASCGGVAAAISGFGSAVNSLDSKLDHEIIPAIGSVPTDADNGKLLQVVDGKPAWAEASISGDTKVLVVTAEWDEGYKHRTASHTPKQIYDYVQSGGVAVLREGEFFYNLFYANEESTTFFNVADDLTCTICEINNARECDFYDQVLTSRESVHANLMQVITVDEDNIPSMTSDTIYNHVQDGGRVVLKYDDRIYSLASCSLGSAYFNYYDDSYAMYCVEISNNGIIKYNGYIPANASQVHEWLDNIGSKLNEATTLSFATANDILSIFEGGAD